MAGLSSGGVAVKPTISPLFRYAECRGNGQRQDRTATTARVSRSAKIAARFAIAAKRGNLSLVQRSTQSEPYDDKQNCAGKRTNRFASAKVDFE